jgi:3-dehydroquinate synthase
MVVECRIAAARGLLDDALLEQLIALLRRCGLPTCVRELPVDVDGEAIVAALEKVRLIRAGSLRYVLPRAVGETIIVDTVEAGEVRAALAACGVGLARAEVM